MQDAGVLYRQIYDSGHYYVETRIRLGSNRVVVNEDVLISAKTMKRVFDGETPSIGCCVCGELDIAMFKPPITVERQARIDMEIRLVSTIEDNTASDWVKKGTFYVDTRDVTENRDNLKVYTFHCFDAMMKANRLYGDTDISFPTTDVTLAQDIARQMGVGLDQRCLQYLNKAYTVQYPSNYTMREALGFIAVMYAGNWIINDMNELQFVPFSDIPETNLLIDEDDDYIVFGVPPWEEVRIYV